MSDGSHSSPVHTELNTTNNSNMKKTLLLSAALMASLSVSAYNSVISNMYGQKISPDGKIIVGINDYALMINDLSKASQGTDKSQFVYIQGDEAYYGTGNGNCISTVGTIVGNRGDHDASYWIDGEWYQLPVPADNATNFAQGITPDGKVICGTIGRNRGADAEGDDFIRSTPCVWELQADGTYGEPVRLPYPTRDFTGRIPQYITAICISNDGNTVVGQVVDGFGAMPQPIVYRRDADNTWSYELLMIDEINPNHVVFPPFPGDGPMMPAAENYLTAAERIEYANALEDWYDSGEDPYDMPDAYDFLGDDSRYAYDKALEEWTKENEIWSEALYAWLDAYNDCEDNGVMFVFNSVLLSPDGKRYVTASKVVNLGGIPVYDAPRLESGISKHDGNSDTCYTPYMINLEDGSFTVYKTDLIDGINPTDITDDYSILGANDADIIPTAYIFPKGEVKAVTLYDYLTETSPETAAWMKEKMTTQVGTYDPENDNFSYEEMLVTGVPHATKDLKTFITTEYVIWDDAGDPYVTFIMNSEYDLDAVESINAENAIAASIDADGILRLATEADVTIYDLAGKTVFAAQGVKEAATGLSNGIYIVKAVANGNMSTMKVAF